MKDNAFIQGIIWSVMITIGLYAFLLGIFYTVTSRTIYPGLILAGFGALAFNLGIRRTLRLILGIKRIRHGDRTRLDKKTRHVSKNKVRHDH